MVFSDSRGTIAIKESLSIYHTIFSNCSHLTNKFPNTMKSLLIFAALALVNAASSEKETTDVDAILKKLGLLSSSEKNLVKQDLDDELPDEDEAMATVMTNALMSGLLEPGDDGEESIMASIMNSNDEEAAAQIIFLKTLIGKALAKHAFRSLGRYAGSRLAGRICNRGK